MVQRAALVADHAEAVAVNPGSQAPAARFADHAHVADESKSLIFFCIDCLACIDRFTPSVIGGVPETVIDVRSSKTTGNIRCKINK